MSHPPPGSAAPARPTLAAVIPARDPGADLGRLLEGIAGLGIFDEVVLVDDGSDPPLAPGPLPVPLRLIRFETPQGAGRARNAGIEHVGTTHLICIDADDAVTGELALLWGDLCGAEFDFCLFSHADSRVAGHGIWGQTAHDRGLWIAAGLDRARLAPVGDAAARQLAQTAAYPWNKIYCTAFLRDHAIRCAETRTHNDIPLHWGGFLAAGRILASNRICIWHRIGQPGQISAQAGGDRLELFDTLGRIARRIGPDSPWLLPFAAFSSRLFDWTVTRIDASEAAIFAARRSTFLAGLLPAAPFARLVRERPLVARRVIRQLSP